MRLLSLQAYSTCRALQRMGPGDVGVWERMMPETTKRCRSTEPQSRLLVSFVDSHRQRNMKALRMVRFIAEVNSGAAGFNSNRISTWPSIFSFHSFSLSSTWPLIY